MQRNSAKVVSAGNPVCWLGANFWSRRGGPRMWTHYDGPTISAELAVLRDHGVTLTRSFLYWPDFHPAPDQIDELLIERFRDFLDRHTQLGMECIPTFIVGHMSGENWDPAWRGERDLYSDVWLVARQAWFAGQVVGRLTDHPSIAGWLLSNEMPIYGRPPHLDQPAAAREEVAAWTQIMVDAVHAAGGRQPISTGDGCWGVEITGVDNGFSVRDIAPHVDFLGPHVYPMDTDVVRQHLTAAFVCELAGFTGLPVVLEEFGVTSAFASEENAAHYYRQVLHNTLLAGATGWIGWNNTDYDELFDQPPYSHHAFEMHFGLTRSDGTPKPALGEMKRFRDVLDRIDVAGVHRPDTRAALIVPSYVDAGYPFVEAADRTAPISTLRQAYVAAREADLPVAFAREADGLPDDAALLLAPSTKQLTAPTWRRLRELAEAGATVYVSYFSGDHSVQRGPWYADLNGLFGVQHELAYGLTEPITSDTVTITFLRDFGTVPESSALTFRVGGGTDARSFLPVRAVDATVVAVDDAGRPALLERRLGAGRVVFATYPFEYFAARSPAVNPEPAWQLYEALAEIAGIRRDAVVDDPRVLTAELVHEDGRRFVWFVSQAAQQLTAKPRLADGLVLTPLDGGEPITEVELAPYGVSVLRLEHRPHNPTERNQR